MTSIYPEELILVRNTVNESVCFNPNSQGPQRMRRSLFSQMTGNEIVQATTVHSFINQAIYGRL